MPTARTCASSSSSREQIARAVEEVLRTRADAILLPTTAIEAPEIGQEVIRMEDGTKVPVMSALVAFTLLHNLTRLPTVAVPAGLGPGGLPTSVQLTTAFGEDALALAIASQLEERLWPERDRRPF